MYKLFLFAAICALVTQGTVSAQTAKQEVEPAAEEPPETPSVYPSSATIALQERKINNLQSAYDKSIQYDNPEQAKKLKRDLEAAQKEYRKMLNRAAAASKR